MPTITSVTGTFKPGGTASIHGTGFGSPQGGSKLLYFSVNKGFFVSLSTAFWLDTTIAINLPGNADVGVQSFFVVVPAGQDQGVRSPSFTLVSPPAPLPSSFLNQIVIAAPGTTGVVVGG